MRLSRAGSGVVSCKQTENHITKGESHKVITTILTWRYLLYNIKTLDTIGIQQRELALA
jgi:hypothetical protein